MVFTDIAGYTALTQLDEPRALDLLEEHKLKVSPIVAKYRGREVKTIGDAFLLEFENALDACQCSVEIQEAFHRDEPDTREVSNPWRVRLRIGIHAGTVVRRQGDIFGDTVNVASRIQPLADPGGICVSGQVYDQIRNTKFHLPVVELDHDAELKNVSATIAIYKILLPWESPSSAKKKHALSDRNRIAVLPFAKVSPDAESEFFAEGITEELISTISKIRQLSVISRTSVMRYRDQGEKKPVGEIAKELRVGSILEGSVRRAGNRVRTSVQLIDVTSDLQVWSEIYDRDLDDVFTIQSQIAQEVARSLEVHVLEGDRRRIERAETKSAEARNLYLRGRLFTLRVTLDSFKEAIRLYEDAIQKDPTYAEAYAGIAECYAGLGAWEILPPREVLPKARLFAMRALEIDDSVAEAHAALATVLNLQDWKFPRAETEFRRAITLNPSLANVHMQFSLFLGQFARSEEAIHEIKRAIELNPLSAETHTIAGVVHLYNERVAEAKGFLLRAIELDGSQAFAIDALGCCYVRSGDVEEGIAQIKKAMAVAGESGIVPFHLNDLAYAYAKAGRLDEVRTILGQLMRMWEEGRGSALAIAGACANAGDKDKAFEWIFRAIDEWSGYLFSIAVDFAYEALWSDPRWKLVLGKIGFPLDRGG